MDIINKRGVDVMDITAVKQQIQKKEPQHFYIFVGEEVAVMDIYINKIAECINVKPTRADSIADIMPKLTTNSFLSVPQCYVIREDNDFIKSDAVQDFVDEKIQNKNIVVLCFYSLDKRTKFYKAYNDSIVNFERLNEQILSKYVHKEIELSERSTRMLIEICESDLSRIYLEIDKIKTYSKYNALTYEAALKELIDAGTIYEPPYDAIFDFVDAVLRRKVRLAYNLYSQCQDIGEANMTLLSVLYNNAKAVLQVQSCTSKDIAKSTGLTGFQIKLAKEKMGHYKNRELVDMMKLIQRVERGIKTGEIEDAMSIEYVLANVL